MEETKSTMGPPATKKRAMDSNGHSNYLKIRAVIRDLRPHFLQVLQTPDYKNSKASDEIREQLKVVIKLYENMKADVASVAKSKNLEDEQMKMDQKTVKEHVKSPERSSENKLTPPVPGFQKPLVEDVQTQGTYVVGGSAFGWNFITFSGKEPVYYGKSKEQFRSGKPTQ